MRAYGPFVPQPMYRSHMNKPELHLPALVWFLSGVVSDAMMAMVLVITLVSILSVIRGIKMR